MGVLTSIYVFMKVYYEKLRVDMSKTPFYEIKLQNKFTLE